MIDAETLKQLIATYEKHGWKLSRVLFSGKSVSPQLAAAIGNVETRPGTVDAAWFTRNSRPGRTTWEIRYLGASPYALVTVVDDDMDNEPQLSDLERRLAETMSKQPRDN